MKVTAETKSGPFNFECGVDEMLLYAGLRHGLTLPYECATGTCGTCRARVVAGSVAIDWDDAPGFAKLRRDKGDILLCQARPREDCVLRVPANVLPQPERHAVPLLRTGTILSVRRLTPT
jgi:toluene monooxygenase electron transfer component